MPYDLAAVQEHDGWQDLLQFTGLILLLEHVGHAFYQYQTPFGQCMLNVTAYQNGAQVFTIKNVEGCTHQGTCVIMLCHHICTHLLEARCRHEVALHVIIPSDWTKLRADCVSFVQSRGMIAGIATSCWP